MSGQNTTHATLLAKLAEGADPAAWREFCERYGELVQRFARSQGLQPADCEDVLQDVLMALTRVMQGFEYDRTKGRFRSFLKVLTLRAVYRRFRQKGPPGRQEDLEAAVSRATSSPQIEQAWEAEWRQYHLRLAMFTIEAEFNNNDRKAFDLYVGGARTAQETAEELGISIDQVYQAKSRILKRLSQLIEKQVKEEG